MTQSQTPNSENTVFSRGSYSNSKRVADILRTESVGGSILLVATVLAVVLANTPLADIYFGVRDTVIGPEVPGFHHLHMKIGTWAADGLLAIFFFLTGLELKKEFAIGDLKSPATAIVPIAAAFGGVITPAIIYTSAAPPLYMAGPFPRQPTLPSRSPYWRAWERSCPRRCASSFLPWQWLMT